jgi:membrane protein DedA with SNARE-associated domain
LPGIYTFISLPAGIAEMGIKKFSIYTFAGSLHWAFALGYMGAMFGLNWDAIKSYFHILDVIVVI